MFSPLGGPKKDDSDIDWNSDLKLYIDDHDHLITRFIMPTVEKHKKYVGNPNAYKLYMKPLSACAKEYCNKFDIKEIDKVFPEEKISELAKTYATLQEKFISKGDYGNNK